MDSKEQELIDKIKSEIKSAIEANNADSLKSIHTELDGLKSEKNTSDALKSEMANMQAELKALKETPQKNNMSIKETLFNSLEAKKDQIALLSKGSGTISLDLKTAGVISTSNFGSGVLQGLRLAEVDKLDRNESPLLSLIRIINGGAGSNPFSWIEKANADGGATAVSEGSDKPYYDFDYVEGKVTAETISAIIPVSKQALSSMPMLWQHINEELMNELMEVLHTQILLGTGTTPELKSIDYYATTFSAGALANTIPSPQVYDVIRAIAAQVKRNKGVCKDILLHPDDSASLDLIKDDNNNYILPPFMSVDGTVFKGVRVHESSDVTAGEFYAGDFSKYMLNIVEDVNIEIGWINDQFRKNQLSVRAEIFCAGGVKAQHTNKLIKGDFTTAIAALQLGA